MEITTETPTLRIYAACLSADNHGLSHGAWIDATIGAEEIRKGIEAMLGTSPIAGAEEYFLWDSEGFGDIVIEDYHTPESVAVVADFLLRHGRFGAAVLAYCEDVDEADALLRNCFIGTLPTICRR